MEKSKKSTPKKTTFSADIEKHLNKKLCDVKFRKEIMANPVAVLKREGINLPRENEKSITQFMKQINVTPKAIELAQKMSVGGQGAWGIGISISWKTPDANIDINFATKTGPIASAKK